MSTDATRIGVGITLASVTPIARDAVIAVPVSSIDIHMSVTNGRSFYNFLRDSDEKREGQDGSNLRNTPYTVELCILNTMVKVSGH